MEGAPIAKLQLGKFYTGVSFPRHVSLTQEVDKRCNTMWAAKRTLTPIKSGVQKWKLLDVGPKYCRKF